MCIRDSVYVADAADRLDCGMVDVAADDAVDLVAARLFRHDVLERADEVHRMLDLDLRPGRKRPVGQAKPVPEERDDAIDDDREVVGPVAEIGQPADVVDDAVELVAVDDQIALDVGGFVDVAVGDDDAAEMLALERTQEFVVICLLYTSRCV